MAYTLYVMNIRGWAGAPGSAYSAIHIHFSHVIHLLQQFIFLWGNLSLKEKSCGSGQIYQKKKGMQTNSDDCIGGNDIVLHLSLKIFIKRYCHFVWIALYCPL